MIRGSARPTPHPDLVLAHEPPHRPSFEFVLDLLRAINADPEGWVRVDGVWHHGGNRLFGSGEEVSLQPREGSAAIVVARRRGSWTEPREAARGMLDALLMVSGREPDSDGPALARRWLLAAFHARSATGHAPKRVAMATPWEPAAWDPVGRGGHNERVARILACCPTALRWEAHDEDGLPHVRIDRVEWTAWDQEHDGPDAMELLRAVRETQLLADVAERRAKG